jgi:hypothetical protein
MENLTTTKPVCSDEPFTLKWIDFYTEFDLDPDVYPITTSVWEATGVTAGDSIIATPNTSQWASGGAVGVAASLKNTISVVVGARTYRSCKTIDITITE